MTDNNNRLHPNINNRVFINPGTGPADNAYEDDARHNMDAFMVDLGIKGIRVRRHARADYGAGRFAYRLYYQGRKVEIQMPGWELARVRFTGADEQNVWDFPRLYVNDDSWLWRYALNCAKADLLGEDND